MGRFSWSEVKRYTQYSAQYLQTLKNATEESINYREITKNGKEQHYKCILVGHKSQYERTRIWCLESIQDIGQKKGLLREGAAIMENMPHIIL